MPGLKLKKSKSNQRSIRDIVLKACEQYQNQTIQQESQLKYDRFRAAIAAENDPHKKTLFASIKEASFPPVNAIEEQVKWQQNSQIEIQNHHYL